MLIKVKQASTAHHPHHLTEIPPSERRQSRDSQRAAYDGLEMAERVPASESDGRSV